MQRHALITGLFLIALTFSVSLAHANDMPWAVWLENFKQEALKEGIPQQTLDVALFNLQPNEGIIKLDRKQPEGRITWTEYKHNIVAETRIATGMQRVREHGELLREISAKYNVQPQFIVALWGIETNYGTYTGNYSIVESLATLAYDGRRSDLFRKEMMSALKIIASGAVTADAMVGSWAGAMGQTQFMPSSYHNYAQDWNGDGHADIWGTQGDVFASIANYLKAEGWNGNLPWGFKVNLPAGFNPEIADLYKSRSMGEWKRMGVLPADANVSVADDTPIYVMYPGSNTEEAYGVTQNYHVLLHWNRSRYFATSVGLLSDAIK